MPRALIVVDVQKDFVEDGALACEGGRSVAKAIGEYILRTGDSYEIVAASKDWHSVLLEGEHFKEFPIHCIAGSPGAEFADELNEGAIDEVFYKGQEEAGFSAFQGIDNDTQETLDIYLRERMNVDTVDICGIATDYCVFATAQQAKELGYNTIVIEDLCVPVTKVGGNSALDLLVGMGIEVKQQSEMIGLTIPEQP